MRRWEGFGSRKWECGMRNAEKMKSERKKVEIGKEEDEKLEGLGHSAWGRDKSSKLKAEG
jgi:hypothetical protein